MDELMLVELMDVVTTDTIHLVVGVCETIHTHTNRQTHMPPYLNIPMRKYAPSMSRVHVHTHTSYSRVHACTYTT